MGVLPPDYDSDPGRWRSWESPRDVHEMLVPRLRGPVLDVGCGEGRLASLLASGTRWVGLDSSPAQLAANPHRPLVRGDMRALPFGDGSFTEVAHLWCL
ncbi:MAG: class I SAM-dependent methyltransferase, partial [Kutzneria sp.]|nr:class I SAM-dependent methyltransferase [Kutzneria sp.]